MKKILTRYLEQDGRVVEMQNSIASIMVGCVFFANQIFSGGLETRYEKLYQWLGFLPLWVWGAIFLLAGVIHLSTLFNDKRWLRKQILLIKGSLWVFLGLTVLQGEIFATSGYIYLLFASSALFAFFSISTKKDVPANVNHSSPNNMARR